MTHLVLYTHYPTREDLKLARVLLGEDVFLDLVMPAVLPLIGRPTIALTIAHLPDNFVAIVQPPEDEIPAMSLAEALQIGRADEEWTGMLRAWRVDELHSLTAREFPRFWLLLAQAVPQGLPPGAGFIVDKWSRRVLCRRFIDVAQCIATGGPVGPSREV